MPNTMTKRPTTRAERRAKEPATLTDRFHPKFWEDADNRQAVIKEVKRRVNALKEDVGCDSAQRAILCERAVFLTVWLETEELNALEAKKFDAGKYTQAVNALSGLLKTLGLENRAKEVLNLQAYVGGKAK